MSSLMRYVSLDNYFMPGKKILKQKHDTYLITSDLLKRATSRLTIRPKEKFTPK